MSTYPNLNCDPDYLKIKRGDDEIKDLRYTNENHHYGNILKSFKIDNEHYKTKIKSLIKKKIFMIISKILIGVTGLSVGSGLTISGIAPVGITCAGGISFLSSISTIITIEYFSGLKIRYTKLRDWINVTLLLYEKTLKECMIDKIR